MADAHHSHHPAGHHHHPGHVHPPAALHSSILRLSVLQRLSIAGVVMALLWALALWVVR